jgi:hypothetical protein
MDEDALAPDEPDRSRINIDQERERRYWTGRFCVTEAVLRRTVTRVGVQADKVEAYLRGSPASTRALGI